MSSHATRSGFHGFEGSIFSKLRAALLAAEKCFGQRASFSANLSADRNIMALKPSLIYLQHILHAIAGGGNRRLILRFHIVLFENDAVRVDVSARKRNQRVAHPKRHLPRSCENKNHPFVLGHFGAEHHAGHDFLFGAGNFSDYFLGANPKFDRAKLRLRSSRTLFDRKCTRRRSVRSGRRIWRVGGDSWTVRTAATDPEKRDEH